MARIPEETLERIKDATDIVDLVSEHVQLARRGGNFFGLCPFHEEKTPSFSVNPQRQIYHCFGCGAGGNVFRFLQEIDGISFVEAVSFLARRSNIALPERGERPTADASSDLLYKANELAQKYFHHMLCNDPAGRKGLDYLRGRGLSQQTIEEFGLGYAPPGWDDLLKVAGRRQLGPETLEKAGLALRRQSGSGHYDRFRDRVTFPIANLSGRPIAFGARALEEDQEPKYLNSPETPIYHKSAVLYGLDRSRDAIRRRGSALVVEGYMDLLSLAQAGIRHAVASAGTALTEEQCRALGRYAQQVVLLFDGDAAGSSAALRGMEVLLGTGLEARAVSLPAEHDPDSFVRDEGPEALLAAVDAARPALDFYLEHLDRQHDLSSVDGRARAAEALKPLVARLGSAVRRDLMLREIARRLGVDEAALRQEMGQELRRQRPSRQTASSPAPPPQQAPRQERAFMGLLLNYPQYIAATAEELDFEAFADPHTRALARRLFDRGASARELDVSLLMSQLEDEELVAFVSTCAMQGFAEDLLDQQWRDYIHYFRMNALKRRIAEAQRALGQAAASGDDDEALRINTELARLNRERRELAAQQNP